MNRSTITLIVIAVVVVVLVLILLFSSIFVVHQQRVALVERFGKFTRAATPGINFKMPIVDRVARVIYLGVVQLDVEVDSKTKDNVFAVVKVAVQYQVIADRAADSYYMLGDPHQQITSFVQDNIRTTLAGLELDAAFESKDTIAQGVETALEASMSKYGYQIVHTLITDIAPDAKVATAMNEINAAQRQRVAANELGEAEKIKTVKAAEAAAEARRLSGEGVANERRAIAQGLADQVKTLNGAGVDQGQAENLLLMTQYFDALMSLGSQEGGKVLFVPSDPQGMTNFASQIRQAMIQGIESGKAGK